MSSTLLTPSPQLLSLPLAKAKKLRAPDRLPDWLARASRREAINLYAVYQKAAVQQDPKDGWQHSIAELGRADLFYLMTFICRRRDMNRDWVYDRCREVQKEPDGCLDLWARFHWKSSALTFGLTIQDLMVNPELTFGIFSHTRDIAKKFLGQIKREFEQNDTLKAVYSDVLYDDPTNQSPKWSENDGLILKRRSNPKEASIEAHGLTDAMPTGRHFDVRVYDDLVSEASVTTPEMVKKTTEAWELSQALRSEHGIARYIGTRYHLADTYGEMIRRGSVKVRLKPATHNGKIDGTPVVLSVAQHDEIKRDMGSKYPAQMLQNPAGGHNAMFDLAWLKRWEVRPRTLNIYIMVDPSEGKRRKKSDRTAMIVVGVDAQGVRYLLDGMCHRMRLIERWQGMKTLHQRWKSMPGVRFVKVGYEKYGMQSDLEYFEEKMRQRGEPVFGIEELNWAQDTDQSKPHRVQRLTPDMEQGRIRFPAYVWTPYVKPNEAEPTPSAVRAKIQNSLWWIDNGELKFRPLLGETAAQRRAKAEGMADCCASPIMRVDEDNKMYDLTLALIEEITYFPFGTHDDAIDALSRIYDLEPTAPRLVKPGELEPRVYADGV